MAPSFSAAAPFVVPVFIPHAGCPQRCVFCNQRYAAAAAAAFPDVAALHKAIGRFLSFRGRRRPWCEISFYGGTFLGQSVARIRFMLETATTYVRSGQVDGIRFSTRPDTINQSLLELIQEYPVSTIELGVQSMNDGVLALSRRGHTCADTRAAMALLKQTSYRVGLHMMVGLPGDTPQGAQETARQLAALAPAFVRIAPTLVLAGSRLADWHARGSYSPLTLEQSVLQVKDAYRIFAHSGIAVVRMGLQPTAELSPGAGVLAGPFHPAFGALVHAALWLDALEQHLEQYPCIEHTLTLQVHPRQVSRLRGQRNANLERLMQRFKLHRVSVRADASLPLDTLRVNDRSCRLWPAEETFPIRAAAPSRP